MHHAQLDGAGEEGDDKGVQVKVRKVKVVAVRYLSNISKINKKKKKLTDGASSHH